MINAVFIALPDTFLQSIDLYPPIACFLSSKFVSPDVPLSLSFRWAEFIHAWH